jgi:tRNA(His) 5'-end guanylyltransferase
MKDDLGDRMKDYYENRTRMKLPRRTNTMIRLDGKAFHSFTRDFDKPFDGHLSLTMDRTAQELCKQIQGAVIAYVQSDEITILLTDYKKLTTDAWFDGNVQKIVSVAASMATGYFNSIINEPFIGVEKMAFFDARVYTIPYREEVINNFIWRQQDCVRNSISMVAQSLYSHKELNGVKTNEMQELCFKKGVNWNKVDEGWKRGRMIIKDTVYKKIGDTVVDKLKKDEDERLVWKDDKYQLRTTGWVIKPAIDFNKNKELFEQYLELEQNIDLF